MRPTLTPVGAAPQVSDNLVDLVHLHAVEFHDGSDENKLRYNNKSDTFLLDLKLCQFHIDDKYNNMFINITL